MMTENKMEELLASFRQDEKGQAAMEFLMTYGWALLIVVIVGAVVFLVVQPSGLVGQSQTGFSGVTVERFGADAGNDEIEMILQNVQSQDVNVTAVYVAPTTGGSATKTDKAIELSAGETTSSFEAASIPSGESLDSGDSWDYQVQIEYFFTDVGSGNTCSNRQCFNSTGTLTGTA